MDPVIFIIVPGFVGGLLLALLIFRMQAPPSAQPRRSLPISTDVINMARIRVEGIGGLGLVAIALSVALFVPRIRQHVFLGLALGFAFAVILIAWRRRSGPMPSSGDSPGANTTLSIDADESADDPRVPRLPPARVQDATA